jgi:hypothetical protein
LLKLIYTGDILDFTKIYEHTIKWHFL